MCCYLFRTSRKESDGSGIISFRLSPTPKAVWYLKCRALTEKIWIDDTEMEDEGIAELLLDENAIAQLPR
jgi:tetratricopeptide repeat protein 8